MIKSGSGLSALLHDDNIFQPYQMSFKVWSEMTYEV